MSKQYCFKCKTTTEPKNYGAGEFCSKCFNYYGSAPRQGTVTREAKREDASYEVTLREAFDKMGLNEDADRDSLIRAAVRQMAREDTFRKMDLSESAAREAARGRDGLGDAVMDVFRQARKLMESAANLDEKAREDMFRQMGLSESAAREAARGRE